MDGDIPAAVASLREFLRLGEDVATTWLERCPECGGLYYVERSYEFLIGFGGSEDYESYTPITPEEVLQLPEVSWARDSLGAELHEYADGTWRIIREPAQHRPQRRA